MVSLGHTASSQATTSSSSSLSLCLQLLLAQHGLCSKCWLPYASVKEKDRYQSLHRFTVAYWSVHNVDLPSTFGGPLYDFYQYQIAWRLSLWEKFSIHMGDFQRLLAEFWTIYIGAKSLYNFCSSLSHLRFTDFSLKPVHVDEKGKGSGTLLSPKSEK